MSHKQLDHCRGIGLGRRLNRWVVMIMCRHALFEQGEDLILVFLAHCLTQSLHLLFTRHHDLFMVIHHQFDWTYLNEQMPPTPYSFRHHDDHEAR